MREILFRAKAINRDRGYHRTSYKNGDWVYGLITRLYDERFENLPAEMTDITGVSGIEVDYKTIGQYTGLKDKNGKRIFEGDLVHFPDCVNCSCGSGDYEETSSIGVVDYDEDVMCFYFSQRYSVEMEDFNVKNGCMTEVEVVGNVFDNPELVMG